MKQNKIILFTTLGLVCLIFGCEKNANTMKFTPDNTTGKITRKNEEIANIKLATLAGKPADNVNVTKVADDWHHVLMSWNLDNEVKQDELSVEFSLGFDPDFWWSPHLAPDDGDCIAQHVFRSPAIIAAKGHEVLVIVPDLEFCGENSATPWFMDFDARNKKIWLGMTNTQVRTHVCYKKTPGMILPKGKINLGFYITTYTDKNEIPNPWDKVTGFLWKRYAHKLYEAGEPVSTPLDRYVEHTYNWAFDSWEDALWQEFEIEGKTVGAPQFIVNCSQSPNFHGDWYQREFLSIWNQAWFSSLRSASGLARWAQRKEDSDLLKKAKQTKELALSAPFKEGIFPSVIKTDTVMVEINGKEIPRPKDWDQAYWTNSNRSPHNHGVSGDWYHILDASWTSLLMLHWYEEIEQDQRLIDFSIKYADFLLTLQNEKGFFPGWLHPETLKPAKIMFETPETSMSVTFLLKLAEITKNEKYADSALKAMDVVISEIIPQGRWEDFETYWSCSGYGSQNYVGKKFERNDMFKQNNFSIYWTAEALLEAYKKTGEKRYLHWGNRTLDELAMTQQVWQPPFIYIPALGGFGVMNFDGEWNDSRQTLFAELYMNYYKETGDEELFERGICAIKAGFVMMYCPENPEVKKLWEKRYSFFGPEDYGFTMENYGHVGVTSPQGVGMGSFTIYDWGNGAASEARNRIYDHYGDVYIDRKRNHSFSIDGSVSVKTEKHQVIIENMTENSREIKIVFEDDSSKYMQLEKKLTIN